MNDENRLVRHQAIVDAFFEALLASFSEASQVYNKPYLAKPYPIFGLEPRPGYIFDDTFWDVFHAHPLHVCHVTEITEGPQFDEAGKVYEMKFKVDEERI